MGKAPSWLSKRWVVLTLEILWLDMVIAPPLAEMLLAGNHCCGEEMPLSLLVYPLMSGTCCSMYPPPTPTQATQPES